MMREERSIVINRPVEEVFTYAMNPRHNAMWNGWIIESVLEEGAQVAVGTTFQNVVKFLGRTFESEAVITEVVPNERSSVRTTAGPIAATGSRIVAATDNGTRFTQTLEADLGGVFGGIAESIVIRAGIRQIESDLQTLKELLEADLIEDAAD